MTATNTMLVAIVAGIIGRWSHNQKAIPSAQGVIEVLFALVLISAMDTGRTAPIARGFSLLFLVAVLLSDNSPLTGLAQSTKGATAETAGNVLSTATTSVVSNTKK